MREILAGLESIPRQVGAIDRPPLAGERIFWPDYMTWLVRTTAMHLEYVDSATDSKMREILTGTDRPGIHAASGGCH